MPSSLKVPLPRLRYSLLGCVSFATNKSGQPSPLKSSTVMPSDLLVGSPTPAFSATSSNRPPPRLWNSFERVPLYDSGVQYDFVAPSSEHQRSVCWVHCT